MEKLYFSITVEIVECYLCESQNNVACEMVACWWADPRWPRSESIIKWDFNLEADSIWTHYTLGDLTHWSLGDLI